MGAVVQGESRFDYLIAVADSTRQFLGKVPPDEPFPKTNDPIEFSKRVKRLVKRQFVNAIRNMFLLLGSFVFLVTAIGFRIKDGEWKAPSPIWKRQVGND